MKDIQSFVKRAAEDSNWLLRLFLAGDTLSKISNFEAQLQATADMLQFSTNLKVRILILLVIFRTKVTLDVEHSQAVSAFTW